VRDESVVNLSKAISFYDDIKLLMRSLTIEISLSKLFYSVHNLYSIITELELVSYALGFQ